MTLRFEISKGNKAVLLLSTDDTIVSAKCRFTLSNKSDLSFSDYWSLSSGRLYNMSFAEQQFFYLMKFCAHVGMHAVPMNMHLYPLVHLH